MVNSKKEGCRGSKKSRSFSTKCTTYLSLIHIFNSNRFDIPVLAEEFLRADVDIDMSRRKFVDVQVIFHKMEQRTLSAAYKFYCGKNLEDAHTAEAATRATYEVLMSQLDVYKRQVLTV